MESVKRLRRWVLQTREDGLGPMGTNLNDLLEIADAIEEEFKEQEQAHKFAYSQGYEFASGIYGQLLDFEKMDEQQEAMAEHGWYRALCADREPMLLGDRMEWANGTFTIHELKFTEGGCTTWDSEHGYTVHADECRHHHEPTVEDVLREFAERWDDPVHYARGELVEQYASKLRLAGDE